MTKYILSSREFRDEFITQIHEISDEYQFIHYDEATSIDWSNVAITIGWKEEWAGKLLANASLEWVQAISAGVDTLPLAQFAQKNILLSNGSGIHAQSITDHLIALLFMESRGIFTAIKKQAERQWQPNGIPYSLLSDKEILIAGTGKIGQALAKALNFFGTQPVGINTTGHAVDGFKETYPLEELIEQSQKADCVINILPLTPETTRIYNSHFFNSMKSSASFYNVGRGPSVDTVALTEALRQKEIAFAALDVFEEEPLPANDPLWTLENVLITPHISGLTPHFQKAFMAIFMDNFHNFIHEKKLVRNQVDVTKGY
ncbi:phosphoglycerate dehydrogenase [Enterococcus gallinarum]|uniref:phosphoglycerate dehydrogenase n=1 Tax=Enterococcus gallinarum TaxID=1353 RepID=UPI000E3F0A1B|nr:phosphoglycerate dehydrogenase [Enterococcus gallinarum]RGC47389.1 hydroxyacid dehydrogenase [Enterococcus gallinarum]